MEPALANDEKRPRQSTACNWCRSHKLKCDTEQPSCRNCRKRGIECVTTNLRRSGMGSHRVEPLGRHRRRNLALTPARHRESSSSPPLSSIFAGPLNDLMRQHEAEDDGQVETEISSQDQSSRATILTLVTDKSSSRRQMIGSGSSIYVLVQWLDLFFAKQGNWDAIFPYFQQSLVYSMEVPLSFPTSLPSLPSPSETKEFISIFLSRIYPVFPIIKEGPFSESVERLREKPTSTLTSKDYPALACAYAVFSAAADEADGHPTEIGTHYLEGAFVLYAHIVAIPCVTSVQSLLLLAIILRSRNKDGASWGVIGQAIRIAQSIGLHRKFASNSDTDDLLSRIWWTAYILERIMELETGRPSAIRDDECDQILPRIQQSDLYFGGLIRLSKIQTRAIDLFYGNKQSRKSTKDLLLEMGRIDRALLDWANEFPESIRPGQELFCALEELHLATYLTLHYNQTMIALHRPAFLSAPAWLKDRIDEHCAGTPWGDRLRYSLRIGAASARAMLKALSDLLLYSKLSRIVTVNQIVLAILVLGIYVTKIPTGLMNDSDIAMLSTFAAKMEKEYLKMGQDAEFARGLRVLQRQLAEHVASAKPGGGGGQTQIQQDLDMGYLDEAWPSLWTEDLTNFWSNDAEQNMLNMYLLDLPPMNN